MHPAKIELCIHQYESGSKYGHGQPLNDGFPNTDEIKKLGSFLSRRPNLKGYAEIKSRLTLNFYGPCTICFG